MDDDVEAVESAAQLVDRRDALGDVIRRKGHPVDVRAVCRPAVVACRAAHRARRVAADPDRQRLLQRQRRQGNVVDDVMRARLLNRLAAPPATQQLERLVELLRANALVGLLANPANSRSFPPRPAPNTTRPPESRSSVATVTASTCGRRRGAASHASRAAGARSRARPRPAGATGRRPVVPRRTQGDPRERARPSRPLRPSRPTRRRAPAPNTCRSSPQRARSARVPSYQAVAIGRGVR